MIDSSMLFTQFGNDLNEDALLFLKQEGMGHSEDTIDYETVITYAFTQYSLKCGLKELGKRWETEVTKDQYQLHIRDTFRPESDEHLTK